MMGLLRDPHHLLAPSPNKRVSGFVALRPNPLTRTSDTRKTLYAIVSKRLKTRENSVVLEMDMCSSSRKLR